MAIKGLSIPVCGNYAATGNNTTYSDPFIADSAVEYGISWTTSDSNPLYADNKIKENDKQVFQSGELTLGTADLPQELSKKILGLTEATYEYGSGQSATENVYDDQQKSPYLGFGIIELHQIDDVDQYRAVFLPKIYFNLPEEAATTKGESVEWQTKSIVATILRSDLVDEHYIHPWMIDAWFTSEADALVYLKKRCGETEGDR